MDQESGSGYLAAGVFIALAIWGWSTYEKHQKAHAATNVAAEEAGAAADDASDQAKTATNTANETASKADETAAKVDELTSRVEALERKESDLEDRLQRANVGP